MELKRASEFDDEASFAAYTLEMFIVSELCKKTVADLNDMDVDRDKREIKARGGKLSFV